MALEWLEYDNCNYSESGLPFNSFHQWRTRRELKSMLSQNSVALIFVIDLRSMIILYMIWAGQKKGKLQETTI